VIEKSPPNQPSPSYTSEPTLKDWKSDSSTLDMSTSTSTSSAAATALLIIDVQNDFLPPSGSLAVPDGGDVLPIISGLLKEEWMEHVWDIVVASQVSGKALRSHVRAVGSCNCSQLIRSWCCSSNRRIGILTPTSPSPRTTNTLMHDRSRPSVCLGTSWANTSTSIKMM
jgi:hypothetical protein